MSNWANSTIYIYALVDPRDNLVRYVGKTHKSPNVRLREHLCDARHNAEYNQAKQEWLQELLDLDLEPRIDILEQTTKRDWPEREKYWIAKYSNTSHNMSRGGGGSCSDCSRFTFDHPEYREYLSEKAKEQWRHPNKRKRILAAIRRSWQNDERHKLQARINRQTAKDPIWRKKVSEGSKRREANMSQSEKQARVRKAQATRQARLNRMTPEERHQEEQRRRAIYTNPQRLKKLSHCATKTWQDPERRQRQGEDSKRRWANPEYKKETSEAMKKAYRKMTPEQLSARARKGHETRRRLAALREQ